MSDDSDDDLPLASLKRAAPAAKNGADNAPSSDSDEDVPLSSLKRKSPGGAGASAKRSRLKKAKAKAKPKPAPKAKAKVKSKPKAKAKKAQPAKKAEGGKPSKKFDMPGQKQETPPEGDALRLFYVTAYEENSESAMAGRWCMEHGLLKEPHAKRWSKKLAKAR